MACFSFFYALFICVIFCKGSRSGAEAVCALMELKPTEEPIIIAIQLNHLKRIPLSNCIQQLGEIKEALAKCDYETVIRLRGRGFQDSIGTYRILNKLEPFPKDQKVIHIPITINAFTMMDPIETSIDKLEIIFQWNRFYSIFSATRA